MARITITPLAWAYIGLLVAWTLVLTGAMAFLLRHRRLPFLSQRRLPLVFSAVILLHLYGISCMPGVLLIPLVPCDVQYWVMSIYLPFGMALLQASNSQLQSVAVQQRRWACFDGLEDRSLEEKSPLSWWRRILQRQDETDKVLFGIGIGMAVQLALSAFIYFGSEMFHPSYGFFHVRVPSEEVRKVQCFVGWEWSVSGKIPRRLALSCTHHLLRAGGFPLSGSSSGPGSTHPTTCGRPATSTTRMGGASKPSAVA